MRIDYSRVLLTTVCLSAASLLHADLGFNGNGQLTIGGGDGKGGLAGSMSADLEGNGNGLAARAQLNLSATVDAETPDFSNLTTKTRQNFARKMNQTDTIAAMFVDDMAEIRVYRDDGVHPISHWAIHRLLGAREVNTTGNATLALFDKNGSSWSEAVEASYDGVNCTIRELSGVFTFVANASIQVPITITAYIFDNDYTFEFGDVNITSSFQSVKFTYSIGAWPFQNGSLGLAVLAMVKTTGMGTKSYDGSSTIVAGEASLMVPSIAMEDSADVNVTVNVQYMPFTGNARAAMLIEWDFPVYVNSLVYDPVMGMTDTTSNTTMNNTTTSNTTTSAPGQTTPSMNSTSGSNSTTAAVTGGVSSLAVSVLSTVLLLALAMNSA